MSSAAAEISIVQRGLIVLRCPVCGGNVESTGSGPGWMSSDQWDGSKAGDYFCVGSCDNPNRENRRVYFWSRAVEASSSCTAEEAIT